MGPIDNLRKIKKGGNELGNAARVDQERLPAKTHKKKEKKKKKKKKNNKQEPKNTTNQLKSRMEIKFGKL